VQTHVCEANVMSELKSGQSASPESGCGAETDCSGLTGRIRSADAKVAEEELKEDTEKGWNGIRNKGSHIAVPFAFWRYAYSYVAA
jgi:hypothetical protein